MNKSCYNSGMIVLEREPAQIPAVLKEYLKDKKNVFVFPTDVAASSWAEWCITHPEESGVKAVALESFLTWDRFKENFMQDKSIKKSAIPSLLRKLFVASVLKQNSSQAFFQKIIAPEFSADSETFSDWLTGILPSLKQWHTRYTQYLAENHIARDEDPENQDYLYLYTRYCEFLEQNKLFEPSWTGSELDAQGRIFILFYPEILEDYTDYADTFFASDAVVVIKMPEKAEKVPLVYHFANSRMEIRRIILAARELVRQKKADWSDIAINVPDLKTFRPYLERELTEYCVPFVIRSGIELTKNCAGSIWSQIYDCWSEDFSFDSVRTLLLNEYVPWKKTEITSDDKKIRSSFETLRENLIREGSRLRCICSYEESAGEKIDIWEKALRAVSRDELELRFYQQLKKDIKALCEASSFENVRTAWFIFKQHFLDDSLFSVEADMLLSRCVVYLNEMIQIEKDFLVPMGIVPDFPFRFFLNELNKKTYMPQTQKVGISVFPYGLSACACFRYQFVIDSSQKNLNIVYRKLGFLSNEKRAALHLTEENENVSQFFIRLYAKTVPEDFVPFSYSEADFSGFAIAHNFLRLYENKTDAGGSEVFPLAELDDKDHILKEKNWFLDGCKKETLCFSEAQVLSFLEWHKRSSALSRPDYASKEITAKMHYVLVDKRNPEGKDNSKIKITQSDLKNFFPCGRKWIFNNVLKLQDDTLETSLMSYFDMGNINHRVLECLVLDYTGKQLPVLLEDGTFAEEEQIKAKISDYVKNTVSENPNMAFYYRPLTMLTLGSQINTITDTILSCFKEICSLKNFGGYKTAFAEKWLESAGPEERWIYAGKIDCILLGEKNTATIIDYKSGEKVPKVGDCSETNGELGDFQIPMYITLWNGNSKSQVANALFFSIAEKKTTFIVSEDKKPLSGYKSTLDVFEKYAQEFYDKVLNNTVEPVKLSQKEIYETCSSCNFKNICRKTFSVAGEKHD